MRSLHLVQPLKSSSALHKPDMRKRTRKFRCTRCMSINWVYRLKDISEKKCVTQQSNIQPANDSHEDHKKLSVELQLDHLLSVLQELGVYSVPMGIDHSIPEAAGQGQSVLIAGLGGEASCNGL
eukprot:8908979-Karenia_brevis.AAC.1